MISRKLRKSLFALYEKAANYMMEKENAPTENEIITEAANLYKENKEAIDGEGNYQLDYLSTCQKYLNKDFDEDMEVDETDYEDMGYEIVENISGFLGQYFGDNDDVETDETEEKHYYKIDVLGDDGYSFMVCTTKEIDKDEVLALAYENELFQNADDAENCIMDDDVDDTDIQHFKDWNCLYEI